MVRVRILANDSMMPTVTQRWISLETQPIQAIFACHLSNRYNDNRFQGKVKEVGDLPSDIGRG